MQSASFDFATANLIGDFNIGNASTAGFISVTPSTASRTFGWVLQAERLTVNWTNLTRQEVGRPSDPSSTYFFTRVNPAVQGEQRFGAANVSSQVAKPEANLLILGPSNTPVRMVVKASGLDADSGTSGNRTWHAGPEVTPTVTDADWSPIRVTFPLPDDAMQATVEGATARLVGNFTMYVWHASVQVRSANHTRTFDSGTTDKQVSPAGPDPGPLVRERVYRLLRLEAQDARLTLQVDQGPIRVASATLPVFGAGVAGFQGTHGLLESDSHVYTLSQEPLKARGTLDVQLSHDSAQNSVLHARVDLLEGTFEVSRPQELATSNTAAPARWWNTWLWFWGAGALALVAIPVVIVRRNAIVIDDVEWALLSGKFNRGARWAQRLVQRNPRDADALFLYGTALLRLNNPKRLITKIEGLAVKLPRKKRTGIAYTLAAAARITGDKRRLRRWAQEAAREPLLRAKLHEDGIWTEPLSKGKASTSRFLQTGYA